MSIKSDHWIRRMCIPPDAYCKIGDRSILLNHGKWDGEKYDYIVRENGLPWQDFINAEIIEFTQEQKAQYKPMIEPFEPCQIKQKTDPFPSSTGQDDIPRKIISYGTSSYGYDLRCGNKFKIFTNINSTVVDPKNFDEKNFVNFEGDVCIIPPNSFALASSVEYFRIPRDVLTVCLGKSTYARCGIIVNVTPFEPEWEGHVTLEFSNTTPLPAKIYANEGVAQVLFLQSDETCDVSYKDRNGKYQGQGAEPIVPRV